VSLAGVHLAQIIIGVLGVLVISGEYATGMIRSSLTAVPKRLPVLWGKAIVLSAVTLALMLVAVFVAFFASQAILAGKDMDVALTGDGVLRALAGAALYLTGIGVIGLGLGALLRHTAGAITTLFAILLVVPGLLGLVLPDSWAEAINPYLPSNAGQSFMAAIDSGQGLLGPLAGFAVFAAYVVVLLGAAALALTRRDA
jgi:ABC-type transport system involved in multi-copper enzyme maturation permease subunit